MTHEEQLRLQAWLDGELPEAEAREVLRRVQTDAAVAAQLKELKLTRAWLAGNELPRSLDDSREFFWSQVKRRIERDEPARAKPQAVAQPASFSSWLRWLIPAGMTALLAALLMLPDWQTGRPVTFVAAEVESQLDDVDAFTFRSDAEGMTVVWINGY